MSQRPLIIPFQTEICVADNKNSPDKNGVRISPDYVNAEYTSYLGGKMEPPPFTFQQPLKAGVHVHFILPACFRRAVQTPGEQDGQYDWEYAKVPDRWIVTRFVQEKGGSLSHRIFIVESNYVGLDNTESTAVPWLEDPQTSHRFMGRSYEYGKGMAGTGSYRKPLTAMGAGDPYFSLYYPECFSVFGFYDDMKDVPLDSTVSYFISGFFSDASEDPFYQITEETFADKMKELGLLAEEEGFFTDHCVLFSQVYGILWEGYSADYPDGKPEGEIHCGMGNTSAEVISAVIAQGSEEEKNWERLFDMLQYEVADTLEDIDGVAQAEDEIHTRTFTAQDGGKTWKLCYNGANPEDIPQTAGVLLARLNETARAYNQKEEEIQYWQDAVFANWYSYMLKYEGAVSPSEDRDAMKEEIMRLCTQIIPGLQNEAAQLQQEVSDRLADLQAVLKNTAIEPEETGDVCYYRPKNPVLMLYGEGIKRNYALADGQELLCQSQAVDSLTDGTVILDRSALEKYAGDIPSVTEEYPDLFFQAMCLNDDMVKLIAEKEQLPGLSCDKGGIAETASRRFAQSWLTLLMEWKVSYFPSRTLSAKADDSMTRWEFDGLDYDNSEPNREEQFLYTGRCVLSPHSLYQFRYVAEKYLSEKGRLTEEMKEALDRVVNLPVLSQNMDGLNQQLLSRLQVLQPPVIGNDSDQEMTDAVLKSIRKERMAVNEGFPLFPLRAGHLQLEMVNVVSTFGRYQNVFSPGMVPVCSEVMGEYENQKSRDVFALLRPRLVQGARLRFDFVAAENENLPSQNTPDTSPVCGILMPELLSGRLALYSDSGEYYGCIRTVYRQGQKQAAWLSPMEQIETPFEDVDFHNERLRNMAAFLLQDSAEGGTAFFDLMELIREQYECALPCESAAEHNLPYIWGRPLVVTVGKAGIECGGGLAFSQLSADYGKYDTLFVEQIGFPLFAGDRNRARYGIVGCYEDWDYTGIYPAYHSKQRKSNYIKYDKTPNLYANGEPKTLTVISEAGNLLYFQTGILPALKKTLDQVFTDGIGKIKLSFETDSVLCLPEEPALPVPETEADSVWCFDYLEREDGTIISKKSKIVAGADVFQEKSEWICDGSMTLQQKET